MRTAWAMALGLALLLAGCSGSDDSTSSTSGRKETTTGATTAPETTGPPTSSETTSASTSARPDNRAPTILSLVATPGASLLVNFTFEASDPDGDGLSWTLAFGDGSADASGESGTGTAAHTFAAAGEFTAKLTVSDASATDEQTVDFEVTTGGGGGAFEPISATLTAHVLCEQCTDAGNTVTACGSWNAQQKGVDCSWLDLPAEAVGKTWTVAGEDAAGLGPNPQVAFMDACAADAAQLSWFETATTETETGTVPENALCMVVMDYSWVEITFTVNVG